MNKKVIVFIILLSLIVIGIITFIYDQISLSPDITINNHYDNIFLEPTTETNVVNIFNNSEFNGENIIAPGSSGIYRFNVANDTKETLKYKLIFEEDNIYNIDIRYKIKKNNQYIVDNWTNCKDIVFKEYQLDKAKYDTYELEWKWFDGDNDSKVSDDSFYKISINIESNGIKKKRSA